MTSKPIAILVFILAATSACDREQKGSAGWFGAGDDARAVNSLAGDAELDANGRLGFEVTSDVYRRWARAQQALGEAAVVRTVAQLGRRRVTQDELDGTVRKVESDAVARSAIEGAGMSPLEYVYATVAIEQAMAVAKGNLAPRRGDQGAPQQNVELARQRETGIMPDPMIGDTMHAPPPSAYYPGMPYPPTPPSRPVPAELPHDPMEPRPDPLPALRDTSRLVRSLPTPAIPAPAPAQPVPARSQPQRPTQPQAQQRPQALPAPTDPVSLPTPESPPTDTARVRIG